MVRAAGNHGGGVRQGLLTPSRARALLPPAALVLVVTLAAHLESLLRRASDGDEDAYSAIARLMLQGGRLYADGGVDNKPPVIFWIYAAAFRLFGNYNLFSVHVLKVAVVLATAVLVGVLAKKLAGDWAGWIAALFYGLFTAAGGPQQYAGANTEVFMNLPLVASMLLLLNRRFALAGALIALACLTKQVAIVNLPLALIFALVSAPRARNLAALLAGFAAGAGLLLGALALTGSAAGFWRWTVVSLASYESPVWGSGQALIYLREWFLPWLLATPLLWAPALYRLATKPWREMRAPERTIAGWLLVGVLGAVASGRFFSHYNIALVAPLAILAGAALAELRRLPRRTWRGLLAAGALAGTLAAGIFLLADARLLPAPVRLTGTPPDRSGAADYVRAHTNPGDRIFVWGNAPYDYVLSERTPASRFTAFLRGFPREQGLEPRNWDTTPDVWPALKEDFVNHPPAFILDTSTDPYGTFTHYPLSRFSEVAGLVRDGYEPVAVVEGVTIYQRRG